MSCTEGSWWMAQSRALTVILRRCSPVRALRRVTSSHVVSSSAPRHQPSSKAAGPPQASRPRAQDDARAPEHRLRREPKHRRFSPRASLDEDAGPDDHCERERWLRLTWCEDLATMLQGIGVPTEQVLGRRQSAWEHVGVGRHVNTLKGALPIRRVAHGGLHASTGGARSHARGPEGRSLLLHLSGDCGYCSAGTALQRTGRLRGLLRRSPKHAEARGGTHQSSTTCSCTAPDTGSAGPWRDSAAFPPSLRWKKVQSWRCLRHADHDGLSPQSVEFSGGVFKARLRTKTSGPDKAVLLRPLFFGPAAYFQHPSWLTVGFAHLETLLGATHRICYRRQATEVVRSSGEHAHMATLQS